MRTDPNEGLSEPQTRSPGAHKAIEYFTLAGSRTALIRWIRGPQISTLEIVQGRPGQWVDEPDLIRFFECFGGGQIDVAELSEEEARSRAAVLSVTFATTLEEYRKEGGERDG
jgi:hypothetical protein